MKEDLFLIENLVHKNALTCLYQNIDHIMKRQIHIILLLVFISACSVQRQDIVGTYKSDKPNFLKKRWKDVIEGYDGFIVGTALKLNHDNSFQMSTCGNLLTGTWYAIDNTLYLKYKTNKWRNDSLQEHGFDGKSPVVSKDVEKVKFRSQKLIFNWESKAGNKFYDVLKKIK